jgi:hypothetical protein
MAYVEARGESLKLKHLREADRELDHLRVKAHPDGTPESPRWIVEHFASEHDKNPQVYEFDDGHEMLAHVAEHACVPEPSDEEGR